MISKSKKPYAVMGAENLTASLYKTGDAHVGFRYRFNIFRLDSRRGRVNQWFVPNDLLAILKLVRVLAAEIDHDGCVDDDLRQQLRNVSQLLDQTLDALSTRR